MGSWWVSLRLGHAHVLTVHRTVIHYAHAATLRRPLQEITKIKANLLLASGKVTMKNKKQTDQIRLFFIMRNIQVLGGSLQSPVRRWSFWQSWKRKNGGGIPRVR